MERGCNMAPHSLDRYPGKIRFVRERVFFPGRKRKYGRIPYEERPRFIKLGLMSLGLGEFLLRDLGETT